jgi:hypothetical protein
MRAPLRLRLAALLTLPLLLLSPAAAQAALYPGPNGPKEVRGAIEQEWLRLGGARGLLGAPLTDEASTPTKPGAYSHFERGSIYWSPATGPHEVHGSFRGYWASQGWENSWLGFPTTNEFPAAGGVGQHFQGGSLYWSPATGAQPVRGAFYGLWASLGWERSFLGFPLTAELPAAGGVFQRYQGGTMYWSPATGAHSVSGAFYGYWAGQGWERGPLGYPTSQELPTATGVRQTFQGGALAWNRTTGVVTREGTPPPPATYLTEARPVESSGYSEGARSVNGVVHAQSIAFTVRQYSESAEFDLARRAVRFRATVGLSDRSSDATGRAQFDVFADGKNVYSRQLGLGQSEVLDLDMTDVLRLRIAVTGLQSGAVEPTFGNPRTTATAGPDDVATFTRVRTAEPVLYLSEQQAVISSGYSSGPTAISGTSYARSVRFGVWQYSEYAEYDLGRAYRRLQAQIGLADDSSSAGRAQMDVFLDGQRIASHQVVLGQAVPLDLDVTKGLRLRLEVVGLTSDLVYPTFGDVRVEP